MIKLILKNLFSVLCFSLCLCMTYLQFRNFFDDYDSSVISFSQFNVAPEDLYPSISICFRGNIISEEKLKSVLNGTVHSADVVKLYWQMLEGKGNTTEEMQKVNFDDVVISLDDLFHAFYTRDNGGKIIYNCSAPDTVMSMSIMHHDRMTLGVCYTKEATFQSDLLFPKDVGFHGNLEAPTHSRALEGISKLILGEAISELFRSL